MIASGKSSLRFYDGNWLWLGLMVIDIFIIISNSSMLNSYQMPNKNNILFIVLSVINMQFMTLSYFRYPWCTHILKYTNINRILYWFDCNSKYMLKAKHINTSLTTCTFRWKKHTHPACQKEIDFAIYFTLVFLFARVLLIIQHQELRIGSSNVCINQ